MRSCLLHIYRLSLFLICSFLTVNFLFSQSTQDSLLTALASANEDHHRLDLMIRLHDFYLDEDQEKAKENLDNILELAQKLNDERGQFKGLVFLASYNNYLGEHERADSAVKKAIDMANEAGDIHWQAEAWHQKGSIYGSGWGKSDVALLHYAQARKLYEQLELEADAAFMSAKMGMMQQVLGKYDEALQLLQEALPVLRKHNRQTNLAIVLNSMGNIHSVLKNHELARQYYEEALEYYAHEKKPSTEGVILFNLGLTINNLEQPEKGFPYLRRAYHIFDSLGNQKNAAASLAMIGFIFNNMNELDSAITYYKMGADLHEEMGNKEDLAIAWLNLGFAHMLKGNLSTAEDYLLGVLNMENVTLQNHTRLLAYQNLGDNYIRWGKYKEATDYLGKAIVLKDSTMGDQLKAQIAQKEVDFQTQLKEEEIKRLNLEKEQQEAREQYLIGISVLVILLLAGIFFFYRNRQQAITREEKLRAQVKEAEAESLREIDQMKSRFFANISHEFRTPLTLILGPAKQLLEKHTQQKEDLQKPLTFIHRNANRLLELVNQLMDLSKLESGSMPLHLSHGDIIGFIKGIVFSFESLAEIKQINYQAHFPNQAINTNFDKDKLEKVLTNLIGNAFKFTPEEGEISINVHLSNNHPTQSKHSTIQQTNNSTIQQFHHLTISIQDTGVGIAQDQLKHIFDRFYQVEGNEVQGTGIGLALTKELIELQGGEIRVSSIAGEGSTFTIYLPLSTSKVSDPQPSSQAEITPLISASGYDNTHPTLLLVEDNADVRLFIADQLRERYQLLEAENGKEGLEMACQHIPDLIISDVMMPEMDGNVLTQKLKTDERTSHIPVILLTAKASQKSKLEGLGTGADDYLTKPFDGEELLVRIKNLIEQRRKLRERFKQDITLKPKDIAITSADERFLNKVIAVVESRLDDEMLSIEEIADAVALSRSQLHRKIKALTDQSPSSFVRTFRLKRAYDLLKYQAGGVAEIAYLTGFSSPTYFSRCFKEQFGVTPGEVKN